MAISFPSNPNLNDTHVVGNVTWTWNGSSWTALAINTASDVNLTGDLIFEGATADDFEATLTVTDPTADRTITLPNQSGNLVLAEFPTFNATVIAPSALLTSTTDVTPSSVGHALQLGAANTFNIAMSTSEIMARDNGSSATLYLQAEGGTLVTGGGLHLQGNNQNISFEGATDDAFETTLTVTDPTAVRTITLPDASGTIALTSDITSYSDADVDTHLNTSTETANQILSWDGADYAWVADQTGAGSTYGDVDVATYLNGNLDSHIIPDTNATYDIGSAEYKIRHLYLSSTSMYMGDNEIPIQLSADEKSLAINSVPLKSSGAIDAVNAGAIDVALANHFVTNGETYTLADGTYIGQELKFWRVAGAGYADITVANAIYTNGANTTAQAAAFVWRLGDANVGMYNCIWNGTAWVLSSGQPAV